jgi:hypothetical protein
VKSSGYLYHITRYGIFRFVSSNVRNCGTSTYEACVFREIPRSVYKLPLLEILDISRNKVRNISREVKNLTSLRVFAIVHNRVEDLPFELSEMTQLQTLKVQENPLRFELKKVIEAKEAQLGPLNLNRE